MEDVQLARLKTIAERGWLRTLDDTLGIAHGERQRRTAQPVPGLPVWEPLLADRPHHIIPRPPREVLAADNPWGFKLQQPKRSEEHTSELQSLMRISYAVFCLKKKTTNTN